ncbi:hypothetical protein B484DRAFT_452713 [Ochromonadaceae sp. CCMP2298]|nr:hypothetical protein B484DRAFT_452713 [Ochromonadaceae sp. CCMP2298]
MNRAQQKAVAHEANVGLVDIRNMEVQYFGRFFSNFGTQAAFMIGFILSAISQVPGDVNRMNAPVVFVVFFWVGSAGCLAFAMHVLVCTIFITVFGEGLALRGPLGSMVQTVQGMIKEQQQVLGAFCLAIVFFTFQAVGMYWIMMDQPTAIACTVLTLGAMPLWYSYALHIYNRFHWGNIDIERWDSTRRLALDSSYGWNRHSVAGEGEGAEGVGGTGVELCTEEGYLSLRTRSPSPFAPEDSGKGGIGGGAREEDGYVWERRYFALQGGLLYFYADQQAFQESPYEPLNHRPIDLQGYSLVGNVRTLILVPADPEDPRRAWRLRCDTAAEYDRWVGCLSTALGLAPTPVEAGLLGAGGSGDLSSDED